MDHATQTDEGLVARAGRGDRAAASALVLRHTDRIYAVCYRMLRSPAAAEDATQETFLRLWTHAAKWRPQGAKFETWLYRVAMNICYDHLRKGKREAPEEAAPERSDPKGRPDDRLLADERRAVIEAALAELPARQKMALTLCHFQELSNIDAAAVMDLSVDALESLLARGRRKLREKLAPMRDALAGDMNDDAVGY